MREERADEWKRKQVEYRKERRKKNEPGGPTQAGAPERRRLKITRRQDETVTEAPSVPKHTQPGVALALAQLKDRERRP